MIYLDHAATTPLCRAARDSMLRVLDEEFANAGGAYAASRRARFLIDKARREIAGCIGAQPSEIYFTSGGSESDNWALRCVKTGAEKRKLLVSSVEHHAVLHSAQAYGDHALIPCDEQGRITPEALGSAMTADTGLVSVMLANNEVGTVQPVRELAAIAHAQGALFHTDAVQAAGHIPLDVNELRVDLLSISAHKFGGPKGVGALYIRKGTRIDPLICGGAQERGLRAGTENTAGILGMAAALCASVDSMETDTIRIRVLAGRLKDGLLLLPGVQLNGDPDNRLPGNVHISVNGFESSLLLARLDMMGVAASAGSACTSGSLERSHVLRAMGRAERGQADIRFSLGAENTEDEIDQTIQIFRRLVCEEIHQ